MLLRALMMTLPVAFSVATTAQPVTEPSSSEPAAMSPAQLADALRLMGSIAPAAGMPLTANAPFTAPATTRSTAAPSAQPPDGYMEAPDTAMSDLETWFLRYGATLHRAE